MHQIQLSDQVYGSLQRAASANGFETVEDYILEIADASQPVDEERLFTPERLAKIDKAEASIKSGNFYTVAEVRDHLQRKRDAWNQESRH